MASQHHRTGRADSTELFGLKEWLALRLSFPSLLQLRDFVLTHAGVHSSALPIIADWISVTFALDAELRELRERQGTARLDFKYFLFEAECVEKERYLAIDTARFEPDTSKLELAVSAEPVPWVTPLMTALEKECGTIPTELRDVLLTAQDEFRKKRAYLALVLQNVDLLHSSTTALGNALKEMKED